MNKYFFLFLAVTFSAALFAAMPGDVPGESKHKLQWVDCSPMPLGKLDKDKHRDLPEYRAIVFMYTRAQDSDRIFSLLENLRRQHQDKLLISVITPDQRKDAENLHRRHPDARLRIGVDTTRKLTPEFMRNTIMLFPMAFLMDKNGMILWRGEAADLPEIFDRQRDNKLDPATVKKVEPLIYKMQQSMRDGNLFKARDTALEILKLDPANPSAARMLVFTAESMNNSALAWKTISSLIKKVPAIPRLYFAALDLTIRHENLRSELPELIKIFCRQDFLPQIRCAFADALLNSFQFESAAVIGAKNILAGTPMPLNANPGLLGQLLALRARLNYALANLPAAEADMREAVEFFKKSSDRTMLQRAEKQLNFFQMLIKEQQEKSR